MAKVVGYQCSFVKTFFNSNLELQYEASFDLEQKSKISLSRFKQGLYKLKENVKCVWVLLQFLFFAHDYINIYNFYFFLHQHFYFELTNRVRSFFK